MPNDVVQISRDEKDPVKIANAVGQLAERVRGLTTPGAATTSTAGIVVLATTTEVLTGTDTAKATTPDAIAALWEKGSDVSSASTISLGEGEYFHITGTTTITDIDFATAKDGRKAILVFDGVLTLTHNATTLILPTGANITTAAGDTCCVVQDAGDNIKVAWYQRANGQALASSTPTFSVNLQIFTSGGTYTPSSNMKYCTIECWGGGGGGGGTASAAANVVSMGGGGGAGSYSRKTASAATIGASQTVTIGTAGTGGTAGNNAGGAGGDTSVGTICIGKAGQGGAGSAGTTNLANSAAGGAGGVAGTGDITGVGENGLGSISCVGLGTPAGQGGAANLVGAGGQHRVTTGTGNAARGKAAGGGVCCGINAGGTAAGGIGAAGYVVITEFILA